MKTLNTLVLTALLLVLPTVGMAQQLVWKFTAGDSYTVTFDQSSTVTTEFNFIERDVTTKVRLVMDWDVASTDDKSWATINQTIKEIQMTMNSPAPNGGKEIQISSLQDPSKLTGIAADMFKQIQPLANATFVVVMKPNGNIESVDATDKTKEAIRAASGSMPLRQLISPEAFKEIFGQTIVSLPNKKLAKGESWDQSRTSETAMGSFEIRETYTFNGETEFEEQSVAGISLEIRTQPTTPQKESENELVNSSGSGKLYFDVERGYFVASEVTNEFAFKKEYRDSNINTETKSTVSMRIVKTESDEE